jgi:hypothetical protein
MDFTKPGKEVCETEKGFVMCSGTDGNPLAVRNGGYSNPCSILDCHSIKNGKLALRMVYIKRHSTEHSKAHNTSKSQQDNVSHTSSEA